MGAKKPTPPPITTVRDGATRPTSPPPPPKKPSEAEKALVVYKHGREILLELYAAREQVRVLREACGKASAMDLYSSEPHTVVREAMGDCLRAALRQCDEAQPDQPVTDQELQRISEVK